MGAPASARALDAAAGCRSPALMALASSAEDRHALRLSAVDASFLRLESPQAHMHIAWSAILALPAGTPRPTIQALRERVSARLHLVPRCRQRVQGAPLGLGRPRLVDDPHFDVAAHVVALSDPAEAISPGRYAELRDATLSQPLDRTRPLWQIALVPRLADGRVGVVGRVHHAIADGAGALQLAALLCDGDRDGETCKLPAWSPRPAPRAGLWALDPLADGAELMGRAARAVTQASRRPHRSAREALAGGRRLALAVRDDALAGAPPSAINMAMGGRRTLTGHRTNARELRAAAPHATLNDAGLAVVAGALRTLMLEWGEPARALKAMVPVSRRRAHEHDQPGNRLSSAAVWLPLDLSSPGARLERVREQTERIKRSRRHEATATLFDGVELLSGPVRDTAFRLAASRRAYNLLVSQIPGPRTELGMLGARLEELYPAVPVGYGHALSIAMLRYHGQLHFGVHADPDALPGVDHLPDLLADEIAALVNGRRREPAVVTSLDSRRAARTGAPNRRAPAPTVTDGQGLAELAAVPTSARSEWRFTRDDRDDDA